MLNNWNWIKNGNLVHVVISGVKCIHTICRTMSDDHILNLEMAQLIESLTEQIQSMNTILRNLERLPNTALYNIQRRYIQVLISCATSKLREAERNAQ